MRQNLVTCPYCNEQFDKSYGRMVACRECPDVNAVKSCGYIRCPSCERDFPDKDIPKFMRGEYTTRR